MSIARRIALGTGKTLLATITATSFGLLTSFILLRYLDLASFGIYSLALSLVAIGTTFLDLGMRNVIVADVSSELGNGNKKRAKEILWSYSKFEIIVSLIIALLVVAGAFMANLAVTQFRLEIFLLIALAIFLNGLVNIFAAFFYSHERFGSYAFLQISASAFELLLMYYFVVLLGAGTTGAVTAFSLAIFLSLLVTSPLILGILNSFRNIMPTKEGLFLGIVKSHGKYSTAASVVKPLGDYAPLWILQMVSGVSAVALYSAAYKIFQFLLIFVSTLETVLLPMLAGAASQGREIVRKIYLRAVKYNTLLSVLLVAVSFFVVPSLINAFFPQYVPSIPLFQIMSFALIVYGASSGQRSVFFAFKAQKELFISFFVFLVVISILGVVLTYLLDVTGMILAFVISQIITLFVRQWLLIDIESSLKLDWKGLVSFDEFDKKIVRRFLKI